MRPLFLLLFVVTTVSACKKQTTPSPQPPKAGEPDSPPASAPDLDARKPIDAPVPERSSKPLIVDFVNAGQGDCIHIACPNGNSIIVDCGSVGKDDPELEDIVTALVKPSPEVRVVVTHQDKDHYSFIDEVLEEAEAQGRIKAVYVGV